MTTLAAMWKRDEKNVRSDERIVALENALGLALYYLEKHEPKDSRAVSSEFVAMAAVQADMANPECDKIIQVALAKHLLSATHTSGTRDA